MWGIVLLLALGATSDPVRIGTVAFLMSGRRPVPNMFAFWLGGMTAGVGVAMAVVILKFDFALEFFQGLTSTIGRLVNGRAAIAAGVLALLFAAAHVVRQRAPVAIPSTDAAAALVSQPGTPNVFARASLWARDLLACGHVWPAFLAGLGAVTPPYEMPVVFAVILGSGAAAATQVSAFVVFTLVLLAVVEIPLIIYLAKPAKSQAMMLQVHTWVFAHRRRLVQVGLALMGVIFVVRGIRSL
jgi:hypothetical protein